MDAGDWRSTLQPNSRQRIVNKIMETLKRYIPISDNKEFNELKKIGVRFEEKVYSNAETQIDYLRKISLKMIRMEEEFQGSIVDPLPSNPSGNNKPLPHPGGLLDNCGEDQTDALRLSHMCQEATKLACYASPSIEAYTIYMTSMKELAKRLESVIGPSMPSEEVFEPPTNDFEHINENIHIHHHRIYFLIQTYHKPRLGRSVKRRENDCSSGTIKIGVELSLNKKRRKFALCNMGGHGKRNCPSNPRRIKSELTIRLQLYYMFTKYRFIE